MDSGKDKGKLQLQQERAIVERLRWMGHWTVADLRAAMGSARFFVDEVREMAANTDPLDEFSFQVNWGGTRTEMLRVSPLRWSTSVVDHRSGSNILNLTQKGPGPSVYGPITLEREIVSGDTEFQTWAGEVANDPTGAFRRDVLITVLDRDSNPGVAFQLRNCWPSSYEAMSELNANATGFVTEKLTLEYDWFIRTDI